MDRHRRLFVPILAILAAAVAGTISYVINDSPDEFSVRLRVQEQVGQRFKAELAAIEGLSYQFIANQDLNEALYAYGKREHRYDVALYNLSFTRHLESQRAAAPLLEEAFFLDYDERERIPLTMTEDFLRPEIGVVRDLVWEKALDASGACAWMAESLAVHGERFIVAARLIKRLNTGEPIGVLALLINSQDAASSAGSGMGRKGAERQIDLLVTPAGEVAAATEEAAAGRPVSAVLGESSYFETVMAQGTDSGNLYVAWDGERAAAIYTRINHAGLYLVSVYPGWSDIGRFRRFMASIVFAAAAAAAVLLSGGLRRQTPGASFNLAEEGELPPGFPTLTEKERRLLALLARGLSNKEIAAEFGIKEQTVKNYLGPLYEKLGVHDRVSALLKLRGPAPHGKPDGST